MKVASANASVVGKAKVGRTRGWRARKPEVPRDESPWLGWFLNSPRRLFIASLASWPLSLVAVGICMWLGLPQLAFDLALVLVSVGFACCLLSALDCGRPLFPQHRRLFTAFAAWALLGAGSERLFTLLSSPIFR